MGDCPGAWSGRFKIISGSPGAHLKQNFEISPMGHLTDPKIHPQKIEIPRKSSISAYILFGVTAGVICIIIILIFVEFRFVGVDFGVREVSQRRDLEILLQMGSGRARDDFKMPRSGTGTFFEKARFEDFLSKSISYASPRPTTTTKMTAIGFSCYGLFTKTIAFAAFLQCVATLLVKSHFFILSLPRSVLFWFCLLC